MSPIGAFGLRSRLLLLVLLALLPGTAIIVFTAWEQRVIAAREAEDNALRLARLLADQEQHQVESADVLLLALAALPEVQSPVLEGCRTLLASAAARTPRYADIAIATPRGEVLCSATRTPEPASVADQGYFRAAVAQRTLVVMGPHVDLATGRPLLTVARPVLTASGGVRAVIYATIEVGGLGEFALRTLLPERSVLLVTDAAGTIVASLPPVADSRTRAPGNLTATLRRGRADGRIEGLDLDGGERFTAFARVDVRGGQPLYAVVGIPADAVYAGIQRLLMRNLLSLGLVTVLAIGLTLVIGHSMLFRRLWALVGAAERLSAGDMSARTGVRGRDEIALVGRTFDGMAERLGAVMRAEQEAKAGLADRVVELDLLNRLGELLQACLTADEANMVMERLVPQFFPGFAGAVFVVSRARTALEPVTTWGSPVPEGTMFSLDDCWALRTGRRHVVDDTAIGLLCAHLPAGRPAAYLCTPLVAQGDALGVLSVSRPPFMVTSVEETKRQLAEAVAEQLALGLANVKLREELRSQSIRDPLTGLYNRRYMEETLEREVRRSRRTGRPMALVMLDVDRFKEINDSFDHDMGDTVLREVGQLLQRNLRREDIACRYGGDEFVLVLAEASLEDALRRGEQLREGVRALRMSDRGQPLPSVTISLGLAAFPEHGFTGTTLLHGADTALLRSKREGRDRASVAGDAAPQATV